MITQLHLQQFKTDIALIFTRHPCNYVLYALSNRLAVAPVAATPWLCNRRPRRFQPEVRQSVGCLDRYSVLEFLTMYVEDVHGLKLKFQVVRVTEQLQSFCTDYTYKLHHRGYAVTGRSARTLMEASAPFTTGKASFASVRTRPLDWPLIPNLY